MAEYTGREPMLDMYIFETMQLVEQLELAVLDSEKSGCFAPTSINNIFRIMHTIKSASAMMLFNNVSSLSHVLEDLFYFIREKEPADVNHSKLTDLVLAGIDFIKNETVKVDRGQTSDGDAAVLIENIRCFLADLKTANPGSNSPAGTPASSSGTDQPQLQKYYISAEKPLVVIPKKNYQVHVFFEDDCGMESIRAFTIVQDLKGRADDVQCIPTDILENDDSSEVIKQSGCKISFKSEQSLDMVREFFEQTAFLKHFDLSEQKENCQGLQIQKRPIVLEDCPPKLPEKYTGQPERESETEFPAGSPQQTMISVNVAKLDKLMDIVGELVIAEAMVTQNPDLAGQKLDNFHKAARQFKKITGELQDVVMSIRMMPLAATFQKMNRIVRDSCQKLGKEVSLEIIGEETEVDKNIIEKISDPLMHLIRNAIDHGIEPAAEREALGKPATGNLALEAKNAGSDVWIIVKDNGRGLNRDKILSKAQKNGLVTKPEIELTEKEIYSFIFLPGFSTKDSVSELSGRGVGMDVVAKNVEKIGGTILVESILGQGTSISIKIPLTLAIIDGMTVTVGNSRYTIPTTAIRESFRPQPGEVITDPDGREMILIRGQCLPIIRLHEKYNVAAKVTSMHEGIIIVIESDCHSICVFADQLLGQQQVVVKALPNYIKKIRGLAGCTLLGDGSISLILDVPELFNYREG